MKHELSGPCLRALLHSRQLAHRINAPVKSEEPLTGPHLIISTYIESAGSGGWIHHE